MSHNPKLLTFPLYSCKKCEVLCLFLVKCHQLKDIFPSDVLFNMKYTGTCSLVMEAAAKLPPDGLK